MMNAMFDACGVVLFFCVVFANRKLNVPTRHLTCVSILVCSFRVLFVWFIVLLFNKACALLAVQCNLSCLTLPVVYLSCWRWQ
eukprot:m.157890 g.157890  ORF g.157890 m.157890 type:complete len:83 (+) comp14336_c0_seq1:3336-3584(+)